VRLRRIREEFGDRVRIEWRSFLLRPEPVPGRTLEKFRAYTQSWLRPAADEDGGTFRVWQTDAGPPSHSIPPHVAAKAAAAVSQDAFQRLHEDLLRAYFAENRDITCRETLRTVWREAELPEEAFARIDDPALLKAVLEEYREALEIGVTGVPALRLEGMDSAIVGAFPIDLYRRWINRALGN
jgi:predicted DsbA family dithiol-disulfide isomerase